MTDHKCEKRVYTGGNFRGHICTKKANGCYEGRWLCGLHSPEADARRKEKADERSRAWDAQWQHRRKQEDIIKHKVGCFDDLLECLTGLLADITEYQTINNLGGENNHWQVRARQAIAKANSTEGSDNG